MGYWSGHLKVLPGALVNRPPLDGGEGVRHIYQLSLLNSYGYERLDANKSLSIQPSTRVMVTAQI